MVLAFALPGGKALHVKEVTVEAGLAVVAAVPDFELHLPLRHGLAAHGTRRPVPRPAPCAAGLHRWQLSTLDGFPCFLAEGGLVLHPIYKNVKQVLPDWGTVRKGVRETICCPRTPADAPPDEVHLTPGINPPHQQRRDSESTLRRRFPYENVGYVASGLTPAPGDIGGGMRVAGAAATKGGRVRPLGTVRPYSVILFSMVL